ncbi:double-strand break repair helicase AddA [Roseitalea porphyridii]|uniref:DNA 3'-5' helicase n=1 Tax=Roseitalea porphyridii TaxID=1852022 RepID=A0A4P6UYI4_9HYPH|nr:double-strand break repair helicase AddA [Roseitalea porphyridii]QBK29374.1 double-strand break repair helicase AddA [Roseitalea porphyridii]
MAKPLPDDRTRADQARAADPDNSAWVSANAGSGKTWVLSTRVIRILLSGTDPSRILCLTYTRAAAAEMKGRVFDRLGAWVALDDAELAAELEAIEGRRPDAAHLAFARTLFARALETPGGLKIQTIHAFCEALLHRFPLEANIAGHFELLDGEAQALLIAQARRGLLASALQRGEGGAGEAVMRLLMVTGESGMERLLDEIVARRLEIARVLDRFSPAADRRAAYRAAFGFGPDEGEADIAAALWPLPGLDAETLHALSVGLRPGEAKRLADIVHGAIDAGRRPDPIRRMEGLARCFLTEKGEVRKTGSLFAKPAKAIVPDIEERFGQASGHFLAQRDRLHLLREIESTIDVLAIADALIGRYETLKRERGFLDFEDLIDRTARLMMLTGASLWVRYKLDQGIDHILVDEAQDTSPAQWDVIRALADEFFAGEAAREEARTVFAVGDEKQSIYSFQGADPEGFADTRDHFARLTSEARRRFAPVELQVSFRSTQAVLDAVDRVFAVERNRVGLTREGLPTRHVSLRAGVPGRVEVWDRVAKPKTEREEDWTAPVDAIEEPALIVATRIAQTIRGWLDTGETIEATSAPIAAGDILVLVRSRDSFVGALSRALKDRGVPVAGADRLRLTDHIAILDLIALGRVMLNSGDDLSLASLLKSPLFGVDEETLFALAHGRDGATLWSRLLAAGENDPKLRTIGARLRRWSQMAPGLPVHEFYAHVLSASGGRARLVGRLGPETADVLDEFLALTLAAERTGPPALETFLNALEHQSPEIKREMDQARGEVRIMTVHGAKGLEAPIVFLVDRGSPPFNSAHAPSLLKIDLPDEAPDEAGALLWRGTPDTKSEVHATAMARLEQAAREEYRRLLYVGMTRAADRLIVAGYRGVNEPSEPTWQPMLLSALEEHCDHVETEAGPVWRFPAGLEPAATTTGPGAARAQESPDPPPAGFVDPAPPEPPPARPLVPSGASGFAVDRESADADVGTPSLLAANGSDLPMGDAMRRGTMIHTLLQMLPDIAPDTRMARARAWLDLCAPSMDAGHRDELLAQVFGVLDDPAFGALFAPASLAEVPVMGTLALGGEPRAISGVIDRLAVTGDTVMIVDYKTGRAVPTGAEAIAESHVRQMALYRALVAPLYPHCPVRAFLLFTAGPAMIEVPAGRLDGALAALAPS